MLKAVFLKWNLFCGAQVWTEDYKYVTKESDEDAFTYNEGWKELLTALLLCC